MEKISAANSPDCWLFNIGTGKDITIRDLVGLIADIVGFQGKKIWDSRRICAPGLQACRVKGIVIPYTVPIISA